MLPEDAPCSGGLLGDDGVAEEPKSLAPRDTQPSGIPIKPSQKSGFKSRPEIRSNGENVDPRSDFEGVRREAIWISACDTSKAMSSKFTRGLSSFFWPRCTPRCEDVAFSAGQIEARPKSSFRSTSTTMAVCCSKSGLPRPLRIISEAITVAQTRACPLRFKSPRVL